MAGEWQRIIIGYRGERQLIHKPSTHDKLIKAARRRFSIPGDKDLSIRLFPELGSSAAVILSPNEYPRVTDL